MTPTSGYQRLTRDTWMVCVKWPGEGWKYFKRHREKGDAVREAAMMRRHSPDAQWRVEKRRYK